MDSLRRSQTTPAGRDTLEPGSSDILMDDATLEATLGKEDDALSDFESLRLTAGDSQNWPTPPLWILLNAVRKLRLSTTCSVCNQEGEIYELLACDACGLRFVFHKKCWNRWPNHRADQITMYEPCAQTEFTDVIWINWLLYCKMSPAEQEEMHADDIFATWFMVPHYQDVYPEPPRLHLYPRIQELVNYEPSVPARQYPSIISFFGETGTGKSTLIRGLIRNIAPDTRIYPVPVPASELDKFKSTSGDVHLYADPGSLASEVPLFYADCEGFKGSGLPVASHLVTSARKPRSQQWIDRGSHSLHRRGSHRAEPQISMSEDRLRKLVAAHSASQSRQFDLRWAKVRPPVAHASGAILGSADGFDTSYVESKSKELIVGELYPRLLYAFSDVVCFITNNARASEKDIMSLFEWASSGYDRTLNQRIRPGLIIVVNKDDPNLDEKWLDVDWSTDEFLKSFEFSPRFNELLEKWAARGERIRSAQDLIKCYYDSFRVVCIPRLTESAKTAKYIARQYKALYMEIRQSSQKLQIKKRRVDMNLDITSFGTYLDHAVSRLAKDWTSSLDFYFLSVQDSPTPTQFNEHLTETIAKIQNASKYGHDHSTGQEVALVKRLTPHVACVIALQLAPNPTVKQKKDILEHFYQEAARGFEKFRDRHWRCEAKDRSGKLRCRNYWEGHEKGHQFETESPDNPHSLERGDYESSWALNTIMAELEKQVGLVESHAHAINSMGLVARASGVMEISSNRTCLACLSNCPTNMLPCSPVQHSICEQCLMKFDHKTEHDSTVVLVSCPFGCRFTSPWPIRVKPRTAGVRILTLDGGGVRGTLELTILERVLHAVGHNIPVQELFDLVIGTSTGGVIALGLFKMDWSVKQAREKFVELSKAAFSPRQFLKIPVFGNAAQLFCSFRYRNNGIEEALQKAFHTEPLFGQSSTARADRVKVGVVSSTEGGLQPCLFANYSRNLTGSEDHLQREDDATKDLNTWQAARCTSAAPIYFQPYFHEGTSRFYIDGAVIHNNPVRIADDEWQRLWPKSSKRPDIVLSLGTGIQISDTGTRKPAESSKSGFIQNFIPRGIKKKVATGFDMVVSTLDCEKTWGAYVQSKSHDSVLAARCHRLNIGLGGKPPKLDQVDKIPALEIEAQTYLRRSASSYWSRPYDNAYSHIEVVARRLVAALFYYTTDARQGDSPEAKEYGMIKCRLSPNMKSQFASLVGSRPEFRLHETRSGKKITKDVKLQENWDHETFSIKVCFYPTLDAEMRSVEIGFTGQGQHWEAISGF